MFTFDDSTGAPVDDRSLAVLQDFERAWQLERPDVAAYWERHPGRPPRLLLELAAIDLEKRFRLGEEATAEEYESRFPTLAKDATLSRELRRIAELLARHLNSDPSATVPPVVKSEPLTAAGAGLPSWELAGKPTSDNLLGTVIGGVSIVRIIADGGMGRVYEGHQVRPRRAVAVKVIKPGIASPNMLRRFEYEAQVLARLRHPGIAQIYSVGTHQVRGQEVPFFVMEYVPNAKSLTQYAEEQRLTTHERLELFRKVCDAVAHGHQKGVIHRDLKPGNVLVDSSGQPKVIDFGVARSTDSDLALTTMQTDVGALIGTLQYMSPEQFDADPHDLDVRLDVYALGVILYELLTGKPPYEVRQRAIHEVARVVREEEPTPLSTLNKTLRRDIAVIAGKCLQKDRSRRYSSAMELAGDVSRYLVGDPITAAPPSFWDSVTRVARRHKAAATAAAGIAVSLVAAVVGITAFAMRAERDRKAADTERAAAEQARADAVGQREVAEQASAKAETARETAVRARMAAEKLVQFMSLNLLDKLQSVGRLDLMQEVLKKLEAYHDQRIRLEEAGDEPLSTEDLRTRGVFFSKLGMVAFAAGDLAAAEKYLSQSLAIADAVAKAAPDNSTAQRDRSVVFSGMGDVACAKGDLTAARMYYEKASSIARGIAEALPRDIEAQYSLSLSLNRLGNLAIEEGNLNAARRLFEEDLQISLALVNRDPRNEKWQRALAAAHDHLGNVLTRSGDLDDARDHRDKAFDIIASLAAKNPSNAEWQINLAVSHAIRGDMALESRNVAEGRSHYEQCLAIMEALTSQDPRNGEWQLLRVKILRKRADLAVATRDIGTARRLHEQALSISQNLARQDAQNAEWQASLGASHDKIGIMALAVGDRAAARLHHTKALEISSALAAHDPQNLTWQQNMARSHDFLGTIALESSDLAAAREHFAKALVIAKRLASQDPINSSWQQNLSLTYSRNGDSALADKDLDSARKHYESSLAVIQALASRDDREESWQRDLAISFERLGLLEKQSRRWVEARDWFAKAMEVADRVFGPSQQIEGASFRIKVLRLLAECHRELGSQESADACEDRIAELEAAVNGRGSAAGAQQPATAR